MKRVSVGLLLLTIIGAASAQRLPGDVTPSHYQITLTPDLKSATFEGEETIDVRVIKPTNRIVLNAAEIKFIDVTVTSGSTTQDATVTTDEKAEMATLAVVNAVPAGPARLHIRFSGVLNAEMRGFYLSKTKERNYAATQFESTDARRAFPCFDEPGMKATFDVTAVIDQGDTGISNGKIVSDTPGPVAGKHSVKFATSPRMSTYLVALEIGDFQCVKGGADGIPIRVCAPPGKQEMGKFALEAAEHVLQFYDRYYAVKYPYQKLDLVAIPDFAAGAMENTADITYRDQFLLIDNRTAGLDDKKLVAQQGVGHEMAHQWFGDLVTMQWWDDIWLNEGFATWMSAKPIMAWKPEWNVWPDQGPLAVDALQATRPIHVGGSEANTPAQIQTLFDGIAYNKTAAVLRMLESWLGEETFRSGVNLYLKQHVYGNTRAADFWNAMAKASGKPVDKVMPTWVEQAGAPMLTVKSSCTGGQTKVELAQTRFFTDPALLKAGTPELWQIPVCVKNPSNSTASCQLMTQKQQTVTINGCSPWVFVNAGGHGYYWSAYSPELTSKLASVAEQALTPQERYSLLNDEWSLVRAGQHPIAYYLGLVQGTGKDRTPQIAQFNADRMQFISDYLVSGTDRSAFQAWVRSLYQPVFSELGWQAKPGDNDDVKSTRPAAINALGLYGRDPEVLRQAAGLADQYMKDPGSVDPNVAGVALALAASDGNESLYTVYIQHLSQAKSPQEVNNYVSAIARFPQLELARRTLETALSPSIRPQDMFQVMFGLLANPETRDVTWSLLKAHWDEMVKKAGGGQNFGFGILASAFCSEDKKQDVEQWFAKHPDPGGPRQLQQGLERLDTCIRIRNVQGPNLTTWLKERGTTAGN